MGIDKLNILIGGEAGEGLVTMGQVLAKALVRNGFSILVTQDYQSRIRGGHNTFGIRMGKDRVLAPREAVDLLIALNEETLWLHREELAREGVVLVDAGLNICDRVCLQVPYERLAPNKYMNTAALGVTSVLLGLDQRSVTGALEDAMGKKDPRILEENLKVLSDAFRWGQGAPASTMRKISRPEPTRARLMMNGNEAIALGALSAGLRFCAFYPMTPATSIALSLIASAVRMGLIVEQAEDEIAAVNMAIGASFTGLPSMVATSGGGFALMTEGVSLAAMTETPLLIVIAQRPGPATGLPTRTEQGDLEFVLHAGHGEFPRAVFAPGSPRECFFLTRKALFTAEEFQGPVFLLTDQAMADSYRDVTPFNLEDLPLVPAGRAASPSSLPYNRYAFTPSGVSPRLLPGAGEHLVVADSDEHTGDGHITENLSVRRQMVEKRLRKGDGIKDQVEPPTFTGEDIPELLMVSWGSSKGAVHEAADLLKAGGKSVATLHFSQVWPLVPDIFLDRLVKAPQVVCVEGNATGQFARLLRRETGFQVHKRILRYDGLPMTPDYILKGLGEA